MAKKDIVSAIPVLVTAFALGASALYQGLVLRTYNISTSKLKQDSSLRIVVVADLHSGEFGEQQCDITDIVRKQHPDLILLPGDIVDDRVPALPAKIFLKQVAKIAPTFYSTGNHEYRTRCISKVIKMVRQCGITVLLNEYLTVNTPSVNLIIAGCEDFERERYDDSYNHLETLHSAFADIEDAKQYSILLAHRPDLSEHYRKLGFDCIVSGHAHGGQVRIPGLINGFYAPHQGMLPKMAGGCYNFGEINHVVSRGVAVYNSVPRIFNPPEITVINIEGK